MSETGVIPRPEDRQPPAGNFCNAVDPYTGQPCDLEHGHDDDHQAIITITWHQEKE